MNRNRPHWAAPHKCSSKIWESPVAAQLVATLAMASTTMIPRRLKRKAARYLLRKVRHVLNRMVRGNTIKKRLLTISQTVDNQSVAAESEKFGAMQPKTHISVHSVEDTRGSTIDAASWWKWIAYYTACVGTYGHSHNHKPRSSQRYDRIDQTVVRGQKTCFDKPKTRSVQRCTCELKLEKRRSKSNVGVTLRQLETGEGENCIGNGVGQ
jgi:hypothetical protein